MTQRPEQCFPSQAQHNRAALLLGVSLLTSWGSVCLCSHPCTMYFVLPGTIHWANMSLCAVFLIQALLLGVTLCPAPSLLTIWSCDVPAWGLAC